MITDAIIKLLRVELVRFLIVGGINTVLSYIVFSFFIFIGLHYTLASFLATVLGMLFKFVTYGRFVFNNTRLRLIVRFVIVYAFVYLFWVSGLGLLDRMGFNDYVAGAIMVTPVAALAFTLNKHFVFAARATVRK